MSTYRSTAASTPGRRPRGPVAARPLGDSATAGDTNVRTARPQHLASLARPTDDNPVADTPPPPAVNHPADEPGTRTEQPSADQPPAAPPAEQPRPVISDQKLLVVVQGGVVQHSAAGVHILDLDEAAELEDPHAIVDLLASLKVNVADDDARADAVNALFTLLRDKF
jgi:hypothetical protein